MARPTPEVEPDAHANPRLLNRHRTVYLVEGPLTRRVAGYGPTPPAPIGATRPITRGSVSGRAIIDRQVIHIEDLAAARDADFPDIWPGALAQGVAPPGGWSYCHSHPARETTSSDVSLADAIAYEWGRRPQRRPGRLIAPDRGRVEDPRVRGLRVSRSAPSTRREVQIGRER